MIGFLRQSILARQNEQRENDGFEADDNREEAERIRIEGADRQEPRVHHEPDREHDNVPDDGRVARREGRHVIADALHDGPPLRRLFLELGDRADVFVRDDTRLAGRLAVSPERSGRLAGSLAAERHALVRPRGFARRFEDFGDDQVVRERRERVRLPLAAHDRDQMRNRVALVGRQRLGRHRALRLLRQRDAQAVAAGRDRVAASRRRPRNPCG